MDDLTKQDAFELEVGQFRADRRGQNRSASADRIRRAEQHREILPGDPDLCAASVFQGRSLPYNAATYKRLTLPIYQGRR